MPGFWETFTQTWGFIAAVAGVIAAVAGFILPFIILAAICGGAAIAWREIWRRIKTSRPHP